ncbi:MAG: protease complex subunit PrcB family protein [Flavobacterium sp.]|uniref:protease complex subunit PrcB family protein n=1 Tax=Flavobacterium sp. TaxID=239 RepID=UPI00120B8E4E|nr:protease complex subunit PrcB family protein [Flavobacterium sp.]RZJ67297.1 MAG: protease complex subunit PrcB family protein [Flavobacterium sp.]
MRKIATAFLILFLAACSSTKKTAGTLPLYEVLTSKSDGGGNIRFYEVVSTSDEFRMLLGDENLKRKIKPDDINSANFIILNMGEKRSGGYSIDVEKVEETADKIVVTVKETKPDEDSMTTQAITYPYAIVKINSKKTIEIK